MAHAIRPLVESGLGERYGIWIRQEEPGFGPHLLRYLSAKRWFPFHQPAVLQAFWEACPEKSRRAFLGPVRWMAVVEEEGGELRVLQASR
jgi:hypothetical protein